MCMSELWQPLLRQRDRISILPLAKARVKPRRSEVTSGEDKTPHKIWGIIVRTTRGGVFVSALQVDRKSAMLERKSAMMLP